MMTPKGSTGELMRAVGYIRVSTTKQAEEGVSLDAQRSKIRAYAELYDLELVTVLADEGKSGGKLDRPELQHALGMLKDGKADALVIFRLDRLTRSVKDLAYLLDNYFASGKWTLLSVTEQWNTKTAAGRLVMNIVGVINQWFREDIAEKTSEAMRYKAERREYTGGGVPYGWALSEDGVQLDPVPEEQKVIATSRGLRRKGMSFRSIGTELEARGKLPRNGSRWHPQLVSDLVD